MVKQLKELFNSFEKIKVLVIGDVMLDSYIFGKVDRISPEAPVPVVAVKKYENHLGGAANVAINIQALGAVPVLCSVLGEDETAEKFRSILNNLKISSEGLLSLSSRKTTLKTRVIGNNHQLLRIDEEMTSSLNTGEEQKLIEKVNLVLNKNKIDMIIFEDYDKGVLSRNVIQQIIISAKEKNIPVAADPKKRNFDDYDGVTLFKPNFGELQLGLKTDIPDLKAETISKFVSVYQEKKNISFMMVTLSEHGVYYSSNKESGIVPAHVRNIADVSGAGDTVISVAALCLAAGLGLKQTAELSNLAGGLVCEKVGVVSIDKEQLMNEAEKIGWV